MYQLKRLAVFLFAASMLLVGVLTLSGLYLAWHSTRDWSTAQATIQKFDVHELPGRRNVFFYTLIYEFRVDGQDYTGETISPRNSDFVLTRPESHWYSSQYRPGQTVDVVYEPDRPGFRSFIERVTLSDVVFVPCGILLLGVWILYLLRMTRVRSVPKRVLQEADNADSPHWHSIYQTVLLKDQIQIRGKAWYARSRGLTQWPNSRVGLVATPNTIGVIRGPFTAGGFLAASLTSFLEFFVSALVAIVHAAAFLLEWFSRHRTWQQFLSANDPNEYSNDRNSADIVSIDDTIIYGYDKKKHELWFRLPSRPVDDCIKLAPDMIQEIEQFIGYVRLMQGANDIATDDHHVVEEIEYLNERRLT